MISLTCTSCRKVLEIDDAFAGGVCRCQYCGTIQTVPASLKKSPRPGAPAPAGAAAGAKTLYQKKTRAGTLAPAPPAGQTDPPTARPHDAGSASARGDGSGTGSAGLRVRAAAPVAPPPPEPAARKRWPAVVIAVIVLGLIVALVLWSGVLDQGAAQSRIRSNPAPAPVVVLLSAAACHFR